MPPQLSNQNLKAKACALEGAPIKTLQKKWQQAFKASLPKGYSRNLIIRGLAYKLQVQAYGGLCQGVNRKLKVLAKQLDVNDRSSFEVASALKPGAKLIREWNARTYIVYVTEDGFEYNQQHYKSLSKIAREITGTRWSGPRFFGLKR